MAIVSQQYDYVVGIDTHAKTHTLMVIDRLGAEKASDTFPTNRAGLKRAYAWIRRNAPGKTLVAMEGTGSYGAQFAALLGSEGMDVSEARPPKRGNRRSGKSDRIDAELAARHALSLPVEKLCAPRKRDGDPIAVKVLLTARRQISAARTATVNQLTALLRGFDLGIDARKPLTAKQIAQVSGWQEFPNETEDIAVIRGEAIRLAKEIERRGQELESNLSGLRKHVSNIAPELLENTGVGAVSAAQILVSWSHEGRVRSEAAFARMGGIAPIPASSGNTNRHRLHRGGDRLLNNAFWVIAFHRYYRDPRTMNYVERRLAEGKDRTDILRCLKRYICRAIFRQLNAVKPA